jgi:uncharacterized membrane protein
LDPASANYSAVPAGIISFSDDRGVANRAAPSRQKRA